MADSRRSSQDSREDAWDASPYTFERENSTFEASAEDSRGSPLFLDVRTPEVADIYEGEGSSAGDPPHPSFPATGETPVIYSLPPTSRAAGLREAGFLGGRGGGEGEESESEESDSDDDDDLLLVESKTVRDTRTIFGQAFTMATVSESQAISSPENKEQIANAAKVVDKVTKVPLSKFWHTFTQAFFIGIFLANTCVEIADIATGPTLLHFKVSSLILGILENCILVGMWVYLYQKKKAQSEDHEKSSLLKHQQYIENIIHEVLLYPIIIMATLGFATEKMYSEPSGVFAWVQVLLLAIDVLDILWTQSVRMFMIYRLLRDLQKILDPDERASCCGGNFAGGLLIRIYFSIIGNTLLFVVIIVLMGAQMSDDNVTSEDYSMGVGSSLSAAALIILPIYSVILFFVANSYWVMELLITINLRLGLSEEIQKKMESDYGASMVDAMGFAANKVDKTQRRLEDIRAIPGTKKILYGLSEFPVILLLVAWEALFLAVFVSFDAFNIMATNNYLRGIFLVITLLANFHLTLLVLAMNVSLPFILLGIIAYPFSLVLCFWKRHAISAEDDDEAFIVGQGSLSKLK